MEDESELAEQAYNEFKKDPTSRELETSSTMFRSTQDSGTTFSVSWYRGSFMASLEHFVDWNVSNSPRDTIYWSSAYQVPHSIFPCIVEADGISRKLTEKAHHSYLGTGTIKVGTPTAWGDIVFASPGVADNVGVYADSSFYPMTN